MEIEGVSIDSRTIRPGELFVCLVGENQDGHRFAGEALSKGAAGLLLSSRDAYQKVHSQIGSSSNGSLPVIFTEDTTTALQNLALHVRGKNPIPIIAVTGSNGKTTTKELIAGILEQRYAVLKNQGNLNNLIGLPLSLLRLDSEHKAAVLEMGMNSPGEIARLSQIAKPNVGVITNVSPAHLDGLGSMQKLLDAKGELVDSLGCEDTVVINMADDMCSQLALRAKSRLITFGNGPGCTVSCNKITNKRSGHVAFVLDMGCQTIPVELNIPGRYNAFNAAAAAAVGLTMEMTPREIKEGLEGYRGLPMRSEIIRLGHDVKIYNDCYNANPKSMEEALQTFTSLTRSRNSTLILGDMLELGEGSKKFHYQLGSLAASIHQGKLLAVGGYAGDVVEGAIKAGLPAEKTFAVGSAEEAAELIPQLVDKGQWVMVKGSRGIGLEKVVERLKKLIGDD